MANTETIELHLPYEVMVCCDSNSIAHGGVTSLTLAMLCPAAWYFGPYMGAMEGSTGGRRGRAQRKGGRK